MSLFMKRYCFLVLLGVFFRTSLWAYTAYFHAGSGMVNGSTDCTITESSDGAGIELPTAVLNNCSLWEFAGWAVRSIAYESNSNLTQPIYRAGTLYILSSAETFYAVYRYKTNRYHEIYVNDQLMTGGKYLMVNTHDYSCIYPNGNNLSPQSIEDYYSTWSDGYIDIDAATASRLSTDIKTKLPYIFEQREVKNHYWALYNVAMNKYLKITIPIGMQDSYDENTHSLIERIDWNLFNFIDAHDLSHRLAVVTTNQWGEVTASYPDFYMFCQATVYASEPDCEAPNHTVSLDAGTNGRVTISKLVETDYHAGVTLPAATPNTGSSGCDELWEFAGWTESGSILSTDSSGLSKRLYLEGEVYYPERDETLHAVFRRKSYIWERVANLAELKTLKAGEKILIAYDNGVDYYVLSSDEASVGYNIGKNIGYDAITSISNTGLVWSLEGEESAWRLKDANGKHLDLTRSDFAYSYSYPWDRWSDEFTITGSSTFQIHSNFGEQRFLTTDGTKFFSQLGVNSNFAIFRQVTTYSKTPKCETYAVLFNSGEGTFTGMSTNEQLIIPNVSSDTGLDLSDSSVPVPTVGCAGWSFAGWRVRSGLNATTNAPGMLYRASDTFIPMQDSLVLYAVYQYGSGGTYYEKVTSAEDVTSGDTYILVNTSNTKAVTYKNSNSSWSGTSVTITNDTISGNAVPATLLWTYNGTYFYNGTDDSNHRLANNGNTSYAGQLTDSSSPFTLTYSTSSWWSTTTYYLRWANSSFSYQSKDSKHQFFIFKQKTSASGYNSWPHCTPFKVVLNACGGAFSTEGDTRSLTENEAGQGVSLEGYEPTNNCEWTFVGWTEKGGLNASTVAPDDLLCSSATFVPKEATDQLYAVYYDNASRLWSSYPACDGRIEVVEWRANAIVVESYTLTGTPSFNGIPAIANADGTYTIEYDVLSNPCTPLLISWGSTKAIIKTPMIVTSYSRTSAVTDVVENCESCDIFILDGGTAVVDKPNSVRNVTIYSGGRLEIDSEQSLTAASFTMCAFGDEEAPIARIQGAFNCPVFNYDQRIDNSRYYWFSLPYDVSLNNVNYALLDANSPTNAIYDKDYYIQFYDGVRRAQEKGTSSSYWTHIADIEDETYQTKSTLKAGRGYLLGLPRSKQNQTGHKYRTLRFPMNVTDGWRTEQEAGKIVAVQGADCADMVQHVGWNLIGNPFLMPFSATSAADVTGGKLEYYYEDGEWVSPWYTIEGWTESVPYVTLYDPQTDEYTQTTLVGALLQPFSAAFVQLNEGVSGLSFQGSIVSKNNVPAKRMGLLHEEEDEATTLTIIAKNTIGSDRSTIIVNDRYNSSYEIGADLLKMKNQGKLQLYTLQQNVQHAFNAMNYMDADSIPIGFIQNTDGEITISTAIEKCNEEVNGIWLYDNEAQTQTNLLSEGYTFYSKAGIYNNRLWLRITKQEGITTDINSASNNFLNGDEVRKVMINGHLYILREGRVYDVLGR